MAATIGGGPQMSIFMSDAGAGQCCCENVSQLIVTVCSMYPQISYLDHVRSHEADTASPALRRVVENVVDSEATVLTSHAVKFVLHKNVLGIDVGEDQINLSLVARSTTAENSLGNLVHGSNTGTTCNHGETADHVGLVSHGTLGTLDLDSVTDLHLRKMSADVAGRVALDENVEVAGSSVIGDGSVGTQDLLVGSDLSLGVLDGEGGSQRNVLANGQTEDGVGAGKTKAVDGGVVRQNHLFGQGELLESGGVKDLLNLCTYSLVLP